MSKSEVLAYNNENKNSWVPDSVKRGLRWSLKAGFIIGGLALIVAAA